MPALKLAACIGPFCSLQPGLGVQTTATFGHSAEALSCDALLCVHLGVLSDKEWVIGAGVWTCRSRRRTMTYFAKQGPEGG